MKVHTPSATEVQGSGILHEALEISRCPRGAASHFAICHGEKIKYLISLNRGTPQLRKSMVAYNRKLALLLCLLPILPWFLLALLGIGYFAQVRLHEAILAHIPEGKHWNILVGTYDSVQKIILQCFSAESPDCLFVKVGNSGSADQMEREINFLRSSCSPAHIILPEVVNSALISEGNIFNILITKEFKGEQIPPILNAELFRLTREIASHSPVSNEEGYEFTHGDFAPWNIRRKGEKFIVFDWEHCRMRPRGYDAAYFIIMVEVALYHRLFDEAFDIAAAQIQRLDSSIRLNKQLIYDEFAKSTKALTF